MSDAKFVLVSIITFALLWGTMYVAMPRHGVIVYDCRLAEISPDYPIDVKNECRKLNSGRI